MGKPIIGQQYKDILPSLFTIFSQKVPSFATFVTSTKSVLATSEWVSHIIKQLNTSRDLVKKLSFSRFNAFEIMRIIEQSALKIQMDFLGCDPATGGDIGHFQRRNPNIRFLLLE